jgi:hypothetical protein
MLGLRACTPAMKLLPISDVFLSTICIVPFSSAPPVSRACFGSCPTVVVRQNLHHSQNLGSWLNAVSVIPRLKMLVSLVFACAAARHQSRSNCHLLVEICNVTPLIWSTTLFWSMMCGRHWPPGLAKNSARNVGNASNCGNGTSVSSCPRAPVTHNFLRFLSSS